MPHFRPHVLARALLVLTAGAGVQAQTLPPTEVRAKAVEPGRLDLDAPAGNGSRLGLTVRETPAAVYQVDRATIEARGDRSTQEALRNVPGITMTDKPDVGGFLSYRGFTGSQITQTFNGITPQYDVVAARPVPIWIYDRVELIGGPSSFLFGAGAVGGAINYVTRLPERGNSAEGLLRLGGHGTAQAAAGLNRQLAGDASQGHFLRLDVNGQRQRSKIEGNDNDSGQIAASLLSDLTPRLKHTLALEYQKEKLDRPYWGTPLLDPTAGVGRILDGTRFKNYNAADTTYEQTVHWARSILEYRADPSFGVKNTLYYYDALRDYRNLEEYSFNRGNTAVTRFSPFLSRHDQDLVGNRVEASWNTRLGGLQSDFSFGLDYSVNRQTRFPTAPDYTSVVNPFAFTPEPFASIPGIAPALGADRQVRVKTLALYLENRTRVLPTVAVVTGLRHDRIDLELSNRRAVTAANPAFLERRYSPTTGRIGVVWDFAPNANLYATYATAADPPAGILTAASFAQVRANTDLTTGRQIEVGSKLGFWDGRAAATVAAYRIERKNLATPDPAAPNTTVLVGEQSSRGVELALDVRATSALSLQASLALVDPQYDNFSQVSGGRAVSLAGFTPPNTPKRVGSVFARYTFAPQWTASMGARAVSRVYGDNLNTLSAPGYTLFDLGLDYQLSRNMQLQARVRNAGDKLYATNVTATPMFYLGEPRSADVTLRMSF